MRGIELFSFGRILLNELFELPTDKVRHFHSCNLIKILLILRLFFSKVIIIIFFILILQQFTNIHSYIFNCSTLAQIIVFLGSEYLTLGALSRLFLFGEGRVERTFTPILIF